MQNFSNLAKTPLITLIFYILIFFVFQKNIFETVDDNLFRNFQQDSEALVVGGIVADELNIDKYGWGLGFIGANGTFSYPENIMDSYRVFVGKPSGEEVFAPYRSQLGWQGVFYSTLQKVINIETVGGLQYIASASLAALVVAFYYLNRKIYGGRYALIFSICLVGSPWIVSIARNLYWSPFLWFLPCFFASMAYLSKSKKVRSFCFALIFFTFFAKSVSGYEFITSVTLFACSPFVLGPLFNGGARPQWRPALLTFLLCFLGFLAAFLMHAKVRGDDVYNGIHLIYNEDVKRRTYPDTSNIPEDSKESLTVKVKTVIKNYVTNWNTPMLPGINGGAFKFIIIFVCIGLYAKSAIKHKTFFRDLIMVSYTALIPLSWFVMANNHSANHTHINFVLWYVGFMPALIFVLINSAVTLLKIIPQCIKNLNPQNY